MKVLSSKDTQYALLEGVNLIGDVIELTLGPKGRNVILDIGYGAPIITNDGATVAKYMFEEGSRNLGISLLKEVALKTNDVAGDGTTTSIVLAKEIMKLAYENQALEKNPFFIKEGMERGLKKVIESLSCLSIPFEDKHIFSIASLSSKDESIGRLFECIYSQSDLDIRLDYKLTIQPQTTYKIQHGFHLKSGYSTSYYLLPKEKKTIVMDKPFFFIVYERIMNENDMLSFLEYAMTLKRNIVLIVSDINEAILKKCIQYRIKGMLNLVIVSLANGYLAHQLEAMEDMALFTNSIVYDDLLQCIQEQDDVTSIDSIEIGKEYMDIHVEEISKNSLYKVQDFLEDSLTANNEIEKRNFQMRANRLSGKYATIFVGGTTDTEIKEKAMHIEDAICAVQASKEEGIVVGAGKAWLNIYKILSSERIDSNQDIQLGYDLLMKALLKPLTQIVINGNYNKAEEIVRKCLSEEDAVGFDAKIGRYVNLYDAGIIDPIKVLKTAIQNAVSISSLLFTIQVAILKENEV